MENKSFRTLLVFPPQWIPLNPHFSLLALAGHLKGEGFEVLVEDVNVRFYRHILTPRFLDYSLARAKNAFDYLQRKLLVTVARKQTDLTAQYQSARFLEIERYLTERMAQFSKLKEILPSALEVFNSKESFYDPCRLVKAFITLDKAFEVISLPYYPGKIKFNDFYTPAYPLSIDGLIGFAGDREENLFYPFLHKEASRLLKLKPDFIGISINTFTQIYAGLTLARFIWQRKPDGCHLNIGGNYFTRLPDVILESSSFFNHFAQSVIVGEGERPLAALLRALEHGDSLEKVPSLIYLDPQREKPVLTQKEPPLSLNELHHQSLDHIQLDSYFVPDPVISIQSSKGCYWQKCTFCDTDFGIQPDIKTHDKLMEELSYLKSSCGIENFEFIDESIFPDYMEKLAARINDEGLSISWFSNARTETAFTRELLDSLRKSGLRMLLWGVESGNMRIMKLINKGVDLERRFDILRASSDAGIWNFAYIFFGFPSETWEEAEETIAMICSLTDIIHSYGRSIFSLGKHAKLREKAEKMGIAKFISDPQEFSTSMSYESTSGMSPREVSEVAEICKHLCARAYGDPLWMYLRYREILFLYIKHFGMSHIHRFAFTPEQKEEINTLFS